MYYLKRKKKEKTLPLFDKAGVKVKKKTNLVDKLDRLFSRYIRLRDVMPNGYFRCISCGQIKPYEQSDCGHYFSRRNMATRFDEDNAHAECRNCNRFKADHLHNYNLNLIDKIGLKRFNFLVYKSNTIKHWSDFELEELIKMYKMKISDLEKIKRL